MISFTSPEVLFKVIAGKRWELLKTMTGAGELTIREVARRLERDVKGVHGDVQARSRWGFCKRQQKVRSSFPTTRCKSTSYSIRRNEVIRKSI